MDHYVFWFDITVDNSVRVNLIYSLTDLTHYDCCSGLRQGQGFFELME